jgi:hypothetical protein
MHKFFTHHDLLEARFALFWVHLGELDLYSDHHVVTVSVANWDEVRATLTRHHICFEVLD